MLHLFHSRISNEGIGLIRSEQDDGSGHGRFLPQACGHESTPQASRRQVRAAGALKKTRAARALELRQGKQTMMPI